MLAGSMLRPSASRQLCTLPPSAAISIIQRNGVVLRGTSGVTTRAMIAYTMAMNSSGGNAATNGFIEVKPTPQISWTRTARAISCAGMSARGGEGCGDNASPANAVQAAHVIHVIHRRSALFLAARED